MINWAAGMMFEIQGRQTEAWEQYRLAHDLIPRNPDTFRYLVLGAARKGRYADVEQALRNDDLSNDDVVSQIVLAGIHGAHGRVAEGYILWTCRTARGNTIRSACPVSTAYLMLGQCDRALRWLEEAFVHRDSQLLWLGSDPVFQPLSADRRFHRLERIAAIKQ